MGDLPRTRRWKEVVRLLLDEESSFEEIASQTLLAVENGLKTAAKDRGLRHTFWLLVQLVNAASTDSFRTELWKLGLSIPEKPSLFDITSTFSVGAQERTARAGAQSDVADIALASAVETITRTCAEGTADLFAAEAPDVEKSLSRLSTKTGFGQLSHEFFSRFTGRYIGYLLGRELSNHVGPGRRFTSIANATEFNKALGLHCRQAIRIIDQFSTGWYSKSAWKDQLTQSDTSAFLHVAFKKLRSEFRRGSGNVQA